MLDGSRSRTAGARVQPAEHASRRSNEGLAARVATRSTGRRAATRSRGDQEAGDLEVLRRRHASTRRATRRPRRSGSRATSSSTWADSPDARLALGKLITRLPELRRGRRGRGTAGELDTELGALASGAGSPAALSSAADGRCDIRRRSMRRHPPPARASATTAARAVVLTLGNFDGVHLGHQAIIARAAAAPRPRAAGGRARSRSSRIRSRVLAPGRAPPMIQSLHDRLATPRATLGVDVAVARSASRARSPRSSPSAFVARLPPAAHLELRARRRRLQRDASGADRAGTAETLATLGARARLRRRRGRAGRRAGGGDAAVSSSRVRRALRDGDVRRRAALLGRPASRCAVASSTGERRGRTLGFPTANLHVDAGVLLPAGRRLRGRARRRRTASRRPSSTSACGRRSASVGGRSRRICSTGDGRPLRPLARRRADRARLRGEQALRRRRRAQRTAIAADVAQRARGARASSRGAAVSARLGRVAPFSSCRRRGGRAPRSVSRDAAASVGTRSQAKQLDRRRVGCASTATARKTAYRAARRGAGRRSRCRRRSRRTSCPEALPLVVLYEDDAPARDRQAAGSWSSIRRRARRRGTVVNALAPPARSARPASAIAERPGIVHRSRPRHVGRPAGGADAARRSRRSRASSATRTIEKRYVRVVHGRVRAASRGRSISPIGRHPRERQAHERAQPPRARGGHALDGASSGFRVRRCCRLAPETGRTHQIRVHLASARPSDRRRSRVRRTRGAARRRRRRSCDVSAAGAARGAIAFVASRDRRARWRVESPLPPDLERRSWPLCAKVARDTRKSPTLTLTATGRRPVLSSSVASRHSLEPGPRERGTSVSFHRDSASVPVADAHPARETGGVVGERRGSEPMRRARRAGRRAKSRRGDVATRPSDDGADVDGRAGAQRRSASRRRSTSKALKAKKHRRPGAARAGARTSRARRRCASRS